jgi:TRAP-type uncharacterized transport system fused permease subunit
MLRPAPAGADPAANGVTVCAAVANVGVIIGVVATSRHGYVRVTVVVRVG